MYAAWLEGATDADIHAIKKAMEKRPDARAAIPDSRAAIFALNFASIRAQQILIRPLKSPEFGSRLAAGKDLSDSSLRNDSKIKWRRGWDCSRPGTAARPPLRCGPLQPGCNVQNRAAILSNRWADSGHPGPRPTGALRASKFAPANLSSTPCSVKMKSPRTGLFIFTDGGEGGIRTHVDANRNQ
jgi:hypothetical protein